MTRNDSTEVAARAPSLVEAELIAGMLRAYGIPASTSTDDAGGAEPQFQLTNGVRVLVAAKDHARARKLIAEADARTS